MNRIREESAVNKTVGFIGLGVMGNSMASHILEAGYPVLVYTRTKHKAEEVLNKGAVWQETVKDLSEKADIIITMVGYPSDVEEIYLGESGILRHAKEGAFVIDMTTSKPSLAKKIAEKAKEKSIHALDAPVSGGDIGARNGTLAIMAGGEKEAFEACLPLFSVMGKTFSIKDRLAAASIRKCAIRSRLQRGWSEWLKRWLTRKNPV